jgi:hypothetical protein
MAVAAIVLGVSGVAVDVKEQFTEEQKNIGGWIAATAVMYSLFNTEEITEVIAKQEAYSARMKEETQYVGSIVQIKITNSLKRTN